MPVDIVNETPLAVAFVAGRVKRAGFHLTAIVKGAFKLVPGGPATMLPRPLPTGDAYFDEEDVVGSCKYASDLAPYKPKADVVVTGSCHQPDGTARGKAAVSLRLGQLRKVLTVFGDRHFVEQKLGGWETSEPAPFRTFPLRYESAFGGAGFADNPVGKGFGAAATRESRALPNVELAGRLLKAPGESTAPADLPPPAGLGPLNRRWGLRMAKMGTYDPAWVEERWPDFPHDFDWTYFNAAPEDQQVDHLRGDEGIVVEGMHPTHARYESWLPGVRPRVFLARTGAAQAPEEVELALDTVSIDMETEELVLVWRGLSPVWSREYAEVEKALIVAESLADPKAPASTFHDVSKWRPVQPTAEELAASQDAAARGAVEAAKPPPQAKAESDDPQEIADVEELRADLVKGGADAALLERLKGVTKLAVFTAILMAHVEELAALAPSPPKPTGPAPSPPAPAAAVDVPPPKSPGEAARREKSREEKEEVDRMRAELAAQNPDPKLLARLADVVTTTAFLAILIEELPPAKTPAEAAERAEALASIRAAEARAQADDAAEAAAERSARGDRLRREEVVAMVAAGTSLAEANLTEVDLSGLDLSKVNLAGAMLAGARLVRTHLAGADLTAATLRKADLSEAVLDGAILGGADLEGAKLVKARAPRASFAGAKIANASFEGALLDQADLARADLAMTSFARASLVETVFDGANLERAAFAHAKGTKATFRGATLSFASLADAELDGAIMASAKVDHLDAARASLRDAFIEGAVGEAASFAEADVTKLRAASVVLPKARFDGVRGEGSRFCKAELGGARFAGALLAGADFTEADLTGANFQLARMQEAALGKAKLVQARLVQVNLFRAHLGGADLTDADCRASNLFECELFEANATRTRFDQSNVKRTLLDRSRS